MGRAPRSTSKRGLGALAISCALAVAACTPSNGVTNTQSMEGQPAITSAPGTIEAPDANGLPSLSTPDPSTIAATLDNGLRYLIRDNDNPGGKVELRLVIDAGSGLEDETQIGGAHFLEHMLFNGTERFPKNELVDVLRSFGAGFGADINAFTSRDETVYSLTVPASDDAVVDTGLDVLAEWLSFATIAADDVDAERGVVLDEARARDQSANGRVFDEVARFLLAGTVYDGRDPVGSREMIATISSADLRRFYDDWYRPDNAAVIVVGDIDPERIERELIARFAEVPSRGADPLRRELTVDPTDETHAVVVGDADLAQGTAFVALPDAVVSSGSPEADEQISILRSLAFDIIATRLGNDALRGDAPFEQASVESQSIVRLLDVPSISITVDGAEVDASIQAILDEFERVARFGFTRAELERVIGSRRSAAQLAFDGRESRQDRSFADEYVRHVLEGEWYVTAQQEFDFVTAVLDRASVETVAYAFVEQYAGTGTYVFVALPDDEISDAPDASGLIRLVDETASRDIVPREGPVVIADSLMDRPEAVGESQRFDLATDPFTEVLDPLVLEFPNGVRVVLNTTPIVEGEVFLDARSPGGLALVPDVDVADAQALGAVVADSGVGGFDSVALDEFLDGKSVDVTPFVETFTEGMTGTAATTDLEVLFQLVNRLMVAPRVDDLAVARYVDQQLPFAEDPGINTSYAEVGALLEARYDDPRYLLPSVESLATVDVDGIERVVADRFGDAGDWTFALSGDYDLDQGIELARAYLATLPSTDRRDLVDFAEPAPPPGAVVVDVEAGQGDAANVSFLFTGTATTERRDDVVALVVQEIIRNRLTDFIREELGDSYSPFASVEVGAGVQPTSEVYISVSTASDLVEDVAAAVLEQLNDLRSNGPSPLEFDNAIVAVAEQLGFINNAQINDEVLDVFVDSGGVGSFDDFVDEQLLVRSVSTADVDAALSTWTSVSDYIEVRVRPRR